MSEKTTWTGRRTTAGSVFISREDDALLSVAEFEAISRALPGDYELTYNNAVTSDRLITIYSPRGVAVPLAIADETLAKLNGPDEDEAEWIVTPSHLNLNYLVAFRRDEKAITAEQFRRIAVRVAPGFTVFGKPDMLRFKVVLAPVGGTVCGAIKADEIARRLNAPAEPWTIVAREGVLLASYGENTPLSWLTAAIIRNAIMYGSDTDEWTVEPHTDHDAATCGTPQAKCRSMVRVSCRTIELDSNDTVWLGNVLVNVGVEAPRSVSPCTLPRREGPWKVVVHESRRMLSVTRTGGMSRADVTWLTSVTAPDYTAYDHHTRGEGHVSLLPLVNPTGIPESQAAELEAKVNKAEKTRLRAVPDQANTPEQDAEDEATADKLMSARAEDVNKRLYEAGKDMAAMRARLDELSDKVGELDRPRTADEVSRAFNAVLDALLHNKQYEAMATVREVRKVFEL